VGLPFESVMNSSRGPAAGEEGAGWEERRREGTVPETDRIVDPRVTLGNWLAFAGSGFVAG
jgi:hypothetical protein